MTSFNFTDAEPILEFLSKTLQKASDALIDISRSGFEKSFKENDDPVTTGDLTVNTILREELTSKFPDIGWLSEETRDNPERLNKKRVWIVDPIDGTREFVEAIPEYTISVALVEDGQPIIGAVANPQRKEFFTAIKGKGAYLNGELIHVKEELEDKLEIVASRSEIKRGEWESLAKQAKIIPSGSIAYKLALVAAGKADATFSLIPKHEWDIAAGCLLVEEAGGLISDKFHQSYIFNRKNTLVNSIVGTSEVSNEIIFEIIEKEMK